jgi:tripartite-type tricarboxylate transporter receptor subunit TctC
VAIVNKLHAEVARALALPEVQQRLATMGADAVGNTPQQFAAFIRAEIPKWARVVKEANIKVE